MAAYIYSDDQLLHISTQYINDTAVSLRRDTLHISHHQGCQIFHTKRPKIIPNGNKRFQMGIKYTNIHHSKALQNLPKFGIFGLKTNHLATLPTTANFQSTPQAWFVDCFRLFCWIDTLIDIDIFFVSIDHYTHKNVRPNSTGGFSLSVLAWRDRKKVLFSFHFRLF
jgi:hypothetical protein